MRKSIFWVLIPLAACSTPQYLDEKSACRSTWLDQLPPKYAQEWYDKSMTREVPTGTVSCAKTATGFTCTQEMKTEHYTVPAVRTVDRNAAWREQRIRACAETRCLRKYGNSACEVK